MESMAFRAENRADRPKKAQNKGFGLFLSTNSVGNHPILLHFIPEYLKMNFLTFCPMLGIFLAPGPSLLAQNRLKNGKFVENGGSRSIKHDLSRRNQLIMWS